MASIKDNTLTSVKEGSIVNFKAIAQTPLKSLRVNFTPIQQGEGDPSPENIRTISGWTGLSVNYCGKNLLNPSLPISTQSASNPIVHVNTNGSITVDQRDGTSWFARDYIYLPAGTYDFYSVFGDNYTSRYILDDNNSQEYSWKNKKTVTLTKTTKIRFKAAMGTEYPVTGWLQIFKTEESYGEYLYNEKIIPVSWSDLGTVYGGYVDLISGEVWQTCSEVIIDNTSSIADYGGDSYNGELGTNRVFSIRNTGCSHPNNMNNYIMFGEKIKRANGGTWSQPNSHIWEFCVNASYQLHIVFDNATVGITSDMEGYTPRTNAIKTWLANNPLKFVLSLEQPVKIGTLTPQEVKTLLGTNNIYSNADNVSVEYYDLESLNLYKQRFKTNQPYLQTASGNVASFQTALKAPLKECKVYFSPVQAEGTPSPDNVLPISGWTGFDLYTAGKNILPHGNFTRTTNGITYNLRDDGSLTIDGQSTGNAWLGVPESLYFRLPINTYTLSGNTLGYSATGYRHYIVATIVDGHSLEKYDLGSGITFTPDYAFDTARLQAWVLSNKTISNKTVYPQLEVGSEATEFEEPVTKKSSITFPSSVGTVYGGYIDLINGEIIQTMRYRHFDENDNWRLGSSTSHSPYRYYVTSIQPSNGIYEAVVSDKLAPYLGWDPYPYMATLNNEGHLVIGAPEELSTVDTFKSWLQEVGGVDVVYPLVTPIHYPLDPITIKTLKGINNIWSNTNGNIQTKYWTYGSV